MMDDGQSVRVYLVVVVFGDYLVSWSSTQNNVFEVSVDGTGMMHLT